MSEPRVFGGSLQILMKQALELPENLFKTLIFASGTRLRRGWFFLIKQKEQ
jgi:hypothetical protein